MRRSVLAACGIMAITLGAAAPAQSDPQLAQLQSQYQTLTLARDQMLACRRDAPGVAIGLLAARWEIGDVVKARYGQAQMDALGKLPKLAAVPCGSPGDMRLKLTSHEQAYQYLTRLNFFVRTNDNRDWRFKLADLPYVPVGLNELRRDLGKSLSMVYGQPAIAQLERQLFDGAALDQSLACEARKTLRTTALRVCPELPAQAAQSRAQGLARVETIEAMAKWLADNTENPFGAPFVHRSATIDMQAWTMRASLPCTLADKAVHLEDPLGREEGEVLILPLRALGTGTASGEMRIKRAGLSAYPSSLVIAGGAGGAEELTRCPNKVR